MIDKLFKVNLLWSWHRLQIEADEYNIFFTSVFEVVALLLIKRYKRAFSVEVPYTSQKRRAYQTLQRIFTVL